VSRKEAERVALHEADANPVRVHVVTGADIRKPANGVGANTQSTDEMCTKNTTGIIRRRR
jgi:hypothetical protein